MADDSLRVEITLSRPGEWRVVERSHSAAESVSRIAFAESELSDLLVEIQQCLLDANASMEAQRSRLRRLGGRLAEISLPAMLREKIASAKGTIEFFLDDDSVPLPVELFPNGDTVLAEALPVSRHWFCENAVAFSGRAPGRARQILIVADPAENLPGAQNEGEALLRKLRSRGKGWNCRFLGRAVTGAELARELPDTDVLHLAAHYIMGDSESASGVVLADGLWMPPASSHTPDLVFANCCRAGLPAGNDGELSLVGRFLRQGTRNVIAPFLPASDTVGKLFASAFYQSFLSGKEVALAVWEARKAVGPAGWIYWHFGAVNEASANLRLKRSSWLRNASLAVLGCAVIASLLWNAGTIAPDGGGASVVQRDEALQGDAQDQEGAQDQEDAQDEEQSEDPYSIAADYLIREKEAGKGFSNETMSMADYAVDNNDMKLLKLLLEHGWTVDTRGTFGQTLLQRAILIGNNGMATWLLENGADPNVKSSSGDSAMHMAAFNGDVAMMRLLRDHGGDVDAVNQTGRTPAHFAVHSGKTETLQWLKDAGADINKPDRDWVTPLWIASKENFGDIVNWYKIEQKERIKSPGTLAWERAEPSKSSSDADADARTTRVAPDIGRDY